MRISGPGPGSSFRGTTSLTLDLWRSKHEGADIIQAPIDCDGLVVLQCRNQSGSVRWLNDWTSENIDDGGVVGISKRLVNAIGRHSSRNPTVVVAEPGVFPDNDATCRAVWEAPCTIAEYGCPGVFAFVHSAALFVDVLLGFSGDERRVVRREDSNTPIQL